MAESIRIGAVLSAGGVRGVYAHTGFLQAIESLDVPIAAIAGCSAGSIVGGIYASGTPLNQWLEALAHMERKDFWQSGSWGRAISELVLYRGRTFTGIAKTDAPLDFCRRNIAVSSFEECHIPFHTVATSLATGKKVMFSQGDLALGIAASSSIPLLYQPVEIEDEFYCDGGVIDLGPTDAICCRHKLDVLIVVLEPSLPELPWPQTELGSEVQATAKNQAEELLEPYLDLLQQIPSELLNQTLPQATPIMGGGCHC